MPAAQQLHRGRGTGLWYGIEPWSAQGSLFRPQQPSHPVVTIPHRTAQQAGQSVRPGTSQRARLQLHASLPAPPPAFFWNGPAAQGHGLAVLDGPRSASIRLLSSPLTPVAIPRRARAARPARCWVPQALFRLVRGCGRGVSPLARAWAYSRPRDDGITLSCASFFHLRRLPLLPPSPIRRRRAYDIDEVV